MSRPVPIALLVDDSCPHVHLYYHHRLVAGRAPLTADGRPLVETIPNGFLDRFCAVVERHGLAGKFSIVPAPAGLGDVAQGIRGYGPALTRQWLATAQARLSGRFDFAPEMLTHAQAVDLPGGGLLPENENDWSQHQDRTTLIPYLTRALELLQAAGVDATGYTSPWVFGLQAEAEYLAAMAAAMAAVHGRSLAWYYLHIWDRFPSERPHVAYARGEAAVVSINTTVDDYLWEAIESPRTDAAFVESLADRYLTADGRGGAIRRVLDAGGWPVLMTHWQGYYANGLETGLAALDLVGRRVATALAGEVEWTSCLELARRTVGEWQRSVR